jgi:hypothetical protein
MAKVPLVPDNALLRTFIKAIEEPDNTGPTVAFVRVRFQRPEFQIWSDSTTLREAAKLALDADLQYLRYKDKYMTGLRKLFPGVKTKVQSLITARDALFEEYEFLRKLMASDNFAISLIKTV